MHTLIVSDEQLNILHNALETWINSFSHDQPDLLRAGKELRAKLDAEISSGSVAVGEGSTFTVN
jgi:hypothetical protein